MQLKHLDSGQLARLLQREQDPAKKALIRDQLRVRTLAWNSTEPKGNIECIYTQLDPAKYLTEEEWQARQEAKE